MEVNSNIENVGLQASEATSAKKLANETGIGHKSLGLPNTPSDASVEDVNYATLLLQDIVDTASPETSLKFSVEEDLSRMVVAVRAVGSDEIIQQFPPEEFISVAKFIAAQNPDVLSEDFLKGVLFDQRS